jgi:hypothetical protein
VCHKVYTGISEKEIASIFTVSKTFIGTQNALKDPKIVSMDLMIYVGSGR